MNINEIQSILELINHKKPIVHHITNYVTANDCANTVLAFGGSPIMADALQEVEEIVSITSALVLNLGTINELKVQSFIKAGKKANALNIPVILDPVGVGVSSFRKQTAKRIMDEIQLTVLKGNMSEIKSIYGITSLSRGVDSAESTIDGGFEIAKALANKLNCIVAITGAIDVISDGESVYGIHNGHALLSRVTGTGCMTSSLVGVCLGTGDTSINSVITGIMTMGIAGEIAYSLLNQNEGLGSYKVYLMDAITYMSLGDYQERGKIYEIKT